MQFKGPKNAAVLILILEGSILGSLILVFTPTSTLQASAQMMGNGGMMGSGIMGSNMNGMQNMMTIQGQLVSVQQAIHMMHNIPSYAKVDSHNNTITFGSKVVNVVVVSTGSDKATNLTRAQPPIYSKGDVFIIYGLINPTLVVQKGVSIQFTVMNLDDTYHNLAISSVGPPYPYMTMMFSMGMMFSNSQIGVQSRSYPVMISFLPPAGQASAHEYSYGLTLDKSGSLWYMCTYSGHAQDGMYGRIIVT